MQALSRTKEWVGEFLTNNLYDVSRAAWFGPALSALRGWMNESFFQRPAQNSTSVNFDLARALYRNEAPSYNLGGGFVKPIIDLPVEYMGMPSVSLPQSAESEALLNECINDYWAPQLQQIFRDSMRDSKVVVRFRQPSILNPLFTEEDRRHGKLEVLPPEIVEISYDPADQDLVDRASIRHWLKIDIRTDQEVLLGTAPRWEEHEIIEIITRTNYTFFDKTDQRVMQSWGTGNPWNFVPVWEVWNEYASDLGGGISDIEPSLPFIQAFHDVLKQTLDAHTYHSTPKAIFNLKDVTTFLANNFPEAVDENGKLKAGAQISWSGRQVFFMHTDEKAGFVEAQSVLGDSKTLLEFLIDCIAISAETPKWAMLATGTPTPQTDSSVEPFAKKIDRKRVQFSEPIVMICKMALAAYGQTPYTPRITWPAVRLNDLISKGQAIQQLVMSFDVATQHEWMSDETIIRILGTLFSEVNAPDVEKDMAKENVVPVIAAPAPPSDTQGIQPAKASTNGKGSKAAGQKAIATTSASRS